MKGGEFQLRKVYGLESGTNEADLYIYDDIVNGSGIPEAIRKLSVNTINVHISSYGGSVCEGIAIYSALKESDAKVITYCDGMACSIASVIFMAGAQRFINKLGYVMIHNAWIHAAGDAKEMQKNAAMLEKINKAAIQAYVAATGMDKEKIEQMMDAETWLDSDEAVSFGFATAIINTDEQEDPSQSARKAVYKMIHQALGTDADNDPQTQNEATVGTFKITKQGKGLLIVPADETGDGSQNGETKDPDNANSNKEKDEEAEQKLSAFFNAFLK